MNPVFTVVTGINLLASIYIAYLGIYLYLKYKWWLDAVFAGVGLAWFVQYFFVLQSELSHTEKYGFEILRISIMFTLLAIMGFLHERKRDGF